MNELIFSSDFIYANHFASFENCKWIFLITHRNPFKNDGGIEHIVRAELNEFSKLGVKVCTIFPVEGNEGRLCSIYIDGTYAYCALVDSISLLLSKINFFAVVVHSIIGYEYNSILRILLASRGSCPVICWVHDFSYICKNFSKIKSVAICSDKPLNINNCQNCTFFKDRIESNAVYKAIIRIASVVVFPSLRAQSNFKKIIPYKTNDLVLPHVKLTPQSRSRSVADRGGEKIGIAFFGHSVLHKGWPNFIEIIDALEGINKYKFFHVGTQHLCDDRVVNINFSEVDINSDLIPDLSRICETNFIRFAVFWTEVEESYGLMIRQVLATQCIVLIRADHAAYLDGIYPSRKIITFNAIDEISKFLSSEFDVVNSMHASTSVNYLYEESGFSMVPLMNLNFL